MTGNQSTGKVRIYDLTKELNLETKEVMSICQQLDIAVKSHSSTIAEEDAERIRATATQSPRRSSEPSPPAPNRLKPELKFGRAEPCLPRVPPIAKRASRIKGRIGCKLSP
jgi:translation initiation factor IF-2